VETTTIIIIVAVIALIAFYLYNRNKPAPHGTYDDKNVRSSGSIGGGTRAHNDPDVRSSGSIGGGTRGHDAPEHTSGGSIGGRQRTENSNAGTIPRGAAQQRRTTPEPRVSDNEQERTLPPLNDGTATAADRRRNGLQEEERPADEQKRNDEFRSGGSFGGSRG
jgi:hypothetical protein